MDPDTINAVGFAAMVGIVAVAVWLNLWLDTRQERNRELANLRSEIHALNAKLDLLSSRIHDLSLQSHRAGLRDYS
jgi:hypothetical protein